MHPSATPLRIVFLDFDGVLNCHAYLSERSNHRKNIENLSRFDARWWGEMIDPKAVEHLNSIVEQTGAYVVVCSSWRHGHSYERLRRVLQVRGFRGEVLGVTPTLDGSQRGAECVAWIHAWPRTVESFVALDDESDYEPIMDRLVKTGWHLGGLLEEHVAPAVALLRTPARVPPPVIA